LTSGFQSPNHTQCPNDLFDDYLRSMHKAELKVVLAVIRHTLGFHRRKARISVREIKELTGLGSQSISRGAKAAEARGLLKRHQDGRKTLWEVVWNDPPDVAVMGVPTMGTSEYEGVPTVGTDAYPPQEQGVPTAGTPSVKESDKDTGKKESIRLDENWNPLFDSLAEVCSVDPKTSGSSLAKITDVLFKAEYRDVDVRQFGRWWVSDDFRKSRGIPPTLWQLQEQIGIVKVQHAKANTENGRRLTESVEEKQKALREELGLADGEFLKAPDA